MSKMAIEAVEWHKKWAQEILNSNLDWEEGMSIMEELTNEAIINKKYGLIVNKRANYTISFILKPPKTKLTKKLRASFEQLNLLSDETKTKDGSLRASFEQLNLLSAEPSTKTRLNLRSTSKRSNNTTEPECSEPKKSKKELCKNNTDSVKNSTKRISENQNENVNKKIKTEHSK